MRPDVERGAIETEERRALVEAIKAVYRVLDEDGKRRALAMMRGMARQKGGKHE